MENKKDYYRAESFEVFDVIEAFGLGFNLGNVCKYICRAGKKTPDRLGDLEKARAYLDREIQTEKQKHAVNDSLKALAAREAQQ